jgi:hypothetical protein
MSQLTAVATWLDGSTRTVTSYVVWNVSDRSVVTVSSGGLLTAVRRRTVGASYLSRTGSLDVRVRAASTFTLTGFVKQPVEVGVDGATIEILDGPSAGQTTQSSGGCGGFCRFFAGSDDLCVRASKDGYLPAAKTVSVTADQRLDFDLMPTVAPVNVAGLYRLTLTASDTCNPNAWLGNLPLLPETKSRTYLAAITQDGAAIHLDLSGAESPPGPYEGSPPSGHGPYSGRVV